MNVTVVIEEYFGKSGSVVVVLDKPQLSAAHHSLLTQTSWSGLSLAILSHRCSPHPPPLEHLLGDKS